MERIGTVRSIHRFPVKSMGGEEVDEARVTAEGIDGDRTWALRDVETDKLVSAKRPRLYRDLLDCTAVGCGDDVAVTLPNGATFAVTDPGLPPALSELLGREVAVEAAERSQQGEYSSDWPEVDGIPFAGEIDVPTNLLGQGTRFVDVSPLHFVTTAALRALGAELGGGEPSVARFRPSFVIDTPGAASFADNEWEGRRLQVGEVALTAGFATGRCVMTTVAQPGVEREPEVLQALARVNRRETPIGPMACLGSYAELADAGATGTIRIGDEVLLGD